MDYNIRVFLSHLINVSTESRIIDGREQTCLILPVEDNQLRQGKWGNWILALRMLEEPPNPKGHSHRIALQWKDKETLDKVVADTMVGGATLTKLLGTSAWYAPGAAAAEVVEAIIHDQKAIIPCSALLDGEYGEKDLCIGVLCCLGKNGIEKIIEIDLDHEEKELFHKSAEAVKATNAALPN